MKKANYSRYPDWKTPGARRRSKEMIEGDLCVSGFVATLKFTNIKFTWSLSFLLLIIAAFGCGQGDHAPISEFRSNDAIEEKIDRVAAAEFKELVEEHKKDIIGILEQNNILPDNLTNPYKHINWHLYKSTNLYIKNEMGTAKIVLSGWDMSQKNNYQKPVVLWFERKEGKWYLVVSNGRLTRAVSSSDTAYNLSPKIHKAFTTLFPHIEYEDWHQWKDPVRKKLALARLKTALPQKK